MNQDQHTILIIDDNESIRKSLAMVLKRKGYVTTSAGTAQEALSHVRTRSYDVALLDMKLPDGDGISVLKQLKDTQPDIQVIMITGFATVESAVQTMGDGAAAYITKPLDIDQLVGKIRDVIEKQELIRKKQLAEEQLNYERNMFDTFLEYIPDTVYFKDSETRFVRVSKSLSDLFGTTPAAMLGKIDAEFFSQEFAALKSRNDVSILQTGRSIINKEEQDSTDRWVTTTKLPWYDAAGNIIGIFGMSRDITLQKHSETKLKHALHELEIRNNERNALFESARSILTYQSFEESVKMLFNSCSQLIGAAAGCVAMLNEKDDEDDLQLFEFNGLHCSIDPDLLSPVFELRAKAIRTQMVLFDNDIHGKAGQTNIDNVLFAPLKIDNRAVGVMGLANKYDGFSDRDVQIASTYCDLASISLSRYRMLETLRASEERFRVIASSAQDAIIMMNNQGNISFWNEAAERIFGYDENEALGKHLHTLLTPESYRDRQWHGIAKFMKTGKGPAIGGINELTALRKNGEEFPLELSLSAVQIENEWHAVGIIRDISQRKQAEEELIRSREQFKLAVDGSQDGIWDWDLRTNELYFSPRWKEMIGYRDDELPNKFETLIAHLHPDDKQRVIDHGNLYLEGKLPVFKIEFRIRHKDGSDRWILARALALRDETGTPYRMAGSQTDISERKQAEELLKQNEQLYRSVVDNIGIGVILISAEMKILTMNKQMKEWFSDVSNLHNSFCYKVFPIEELDRPCLCCPAEQTFRDRRTHTEDVSHDGKHHYRVVSSPIFDMDGNVAAVIEMVDDITEILQIEQAKQEYAEKLEATVAERTKDLEESLQKTREANEQINAILKSAAEGIVVTDTNNTIILMNRASEQLLQVHMQDVINKPIESAIDNATLIEHLHATMKQESDNSCTFEVESDRDQRYLKANISNIHGNSGECIGKIISFHDITREHEIDRMKTEFISTAAHELRTPLTSILGFSEILYTRQDISDQEQQKYLGYINKQSVRLAKIINEILDISRIESGKGIELNKEKCAIHDLIAQVTELFREQSTAHKLTLRLPDTRVMLNADAEKIEQVLKNVLSNAVKYSPGGGEITVSGTLDDTQYRIDISDQGIGMTADQLERIYDKFYRADASNTAIEGTGLGMSIVKLITEAHGGTVSVTSEPGVGTCVSLKLPT